jgi:hypothetical protein
MGPWVGTYPAARSAGRPCSALLIALAGLGALLVVMRHSQTMQQQLLLLEGAEETPAAAAPSTLVLYVFSDHEAAAADNLAFFVLEVTQGVGWAVGTAAFAARAVVWCAGLLLHKPAPASPDCRRACRRATAAPMPSSSRARRRLPCPTLPSLPSLPRPRPGQHAPTPSRHLNTQFHARECPISSRLRLAAMHSSGSEAGNPSGGTSFAS